MTQNKSKLIKKDLKQDKTGTHEKKTENYQIGLIFSTLQKKNHRVSIYELFWQK